MQIRTSEKNLDKNLTQRSRVPKRKRFRFGIAKKSLEKVVSSIRHTEYITQLLDPRADSGILIKKVFIFIQAKYHVSEILVENDKGTLTQTLVFM